MSLLYFALLSVYKDTFLFLTGQARWCQQAKNRGLTSSITAQELYAWQQWGCLPFCLCRGLESEHGR